MLHHVEERFEHSRGEGHRRPIQPLQEPFRRVEPEIAEFVEVSAGSLHRRFQKNSEKFSRNLKTFIMRRAKLPKRKSPQASRANKVH
jgi:hypothetical protein